MSGLKSSKKGSDMGRAMSSTAVLVAMAASLASGAALATSAAADIIPTGPEPPVVIELNGPDHFCPAGYRGVDVGESGTNVLVCENVV
jgi:hypothetical protein